MNIKSILQTSLGLAGLVASSAIGIPRWDSDGVAKRQDDQGPLVFCHFMIGIVGSRTSAKDYDDDMKRAKAAGIDAFALNIGVDPNTDAQLELAYESAAENDMKVFISFDFNWYQTSEASRVGQTIAKYGGKPAQLKYDGKVFASSFAGDGLDVAALREAAGKEDVFWVPNFHPEQKTDFGPIDGALNWMAWPNDGNNKAPKAGANVSVEDGDNAYLDALGRKPYLAPVSPWFFTHFGPEVSYSKNWLFPSDTLWYDRWQHILGLKPSFVEIVTWNDYGESHYVGRLDSPHGDDGNSKWVYGFPHNGWLDMAVPFIKAYKEGADDVAKHIENDEIVYWYRPTLKSLNCDSTDTTMGDANNDTGNYFKGRPDGWETAQDKVYVVTLLTEEASLEMHAGNHSQTVKAPAGASISSVDMSPGEVSFRLVRGDEAVLEGKSAMKILDHCPCGIYNFNPYVGTLPPGEKDELLPEGYASISAGLKVSTCGPNAMAATAVPAADAAPTS